MSQRPSHTPKGGAQKRPTSNYRDHDPRRPDSEEGTRDGIKLPSDVRYGCNLPQARRLGEECPDQYHYLYRAGELLVDEGDLDRLAVQLERQRMRILDACPAATSSLRLIRVAKRAPIPTLVQYLRKLDLHVGPNIVFHGTTHIGVTPNGSPREARALQALSPFRNPPQATVAVIDTGVNVNDPFFNGHCVGAPEPAPAPGGPLPPCAGHGTFVAATILDLLRNHNVLVRSYAPMSTAGFCDDNALAGALNDLMTNRVDVINLSAGGQILDPAMTQTLQQLKALRKKYPELLIVASAGNDASALDFYPAADPEVIAVAATIAGPVDPLNPQLACFTNHGNWVNACAVGVGRRSTFLTYKGQIIPCAQSRNCPKSPDDGKRDFKGGAQWSGTSFSAPVVTAEVVRRRLNGESGAQILNSYPAGIHNGAGTFVAG